MQRFMFSPQTYLPLFTEDGGGSGGTVGTGSTSDDANTGGQPGGEGTQEHTQHAQPFASFPDSASFTARMDREANSRLEATAKELGYESVDAMKAAAKDARAREENEKSELQRAQEAAANAKTASDAAIASANTRAINAEAKVAAAELGIKPERLAYALKLADLSAISIGADGEPDAAAIKAAMQAVVTDLPELVGTVPSSVGGGSNPGAGNTGQKNPWLKENLNLTEQARLLREQPALAQQFKAAAQG